MVALDLGMTLQVTFTAVLTHDPPPQPYQHRARLPVPRSRTRRGRMSCTARVLNPHHGQRETDQVDSTSTTKPLIVSIGDEDG